jgi:hypothetical protein
MMGGHGLPGGGSAEKFTVEQVQHALEISRGIKTLVARSLGCSRNTVQSYINRYPELQVSFRETIDENLDMAESQLITALSSGQPWAIKFYLSTQGRDRGYGRTEFSVKLPEGGVPVRVEMGEPDPQRIASIVNVLRDAGVLDRVLKSNGHAVLTAGEEDPPKLQ